MKLNVKNYTLLIVAGGFFLIVGLIMTINKKENNYYYYEEALLTQDEANLLILEKTKIVMDLYEKADTFFDVEKTEQPQEDFSYTNEDYIKVKNYDEKIDEIYTEDGKKELESIKFDGKIFINKQENGVYVLAKIPNNNSFLNNSIYIENINIKKEKITATVVFSSADLGTDDVLSYYVYEKNIELIKKDKEWYINTFIYSNV